MNKFLLLSILFTLLYGCSQSELPAEKENKINTPKIDETLLAPSNFYYETSTAIYFKDKEILENIPNIEGSLDNISYSINPALPIGLSLNSQTGIISGTPTVLQDKKNYTVSVKNDYGLVSYTMSIKISVPPPQNLSYNLSNEIYYRNINIGNFTPFVEGNVINYSIEPSLPQGLSFNTVNGEVSGTPSSLLPKQNFIVKAHNNSGFSSYEFFLNIIDVAPTNLYYDLVDTTYSVNETILSNRPNSSGGAVDLYVIDPVELPPGLFFNSQNGRIEGRPLYELPNPKEYTITAFNTGGSTSTVISIRILDKAPPEPNYLYTNINYTKNEAIESNTVECSGTLYDPEICPDGRPTHFEITPSLPSGLFLNPNNGTIYGEPSVLADYQNYLITASNSGGQKQTSLSIAVIDKPPYLLRYENNDFNIRKNESFEANIVNNEGGAVVSYSITPNLPNGMFFNTETGKINGIPLDETNDQIYTVSGFNSGGSFSSLINLEVLPVPNYNFEYKLLGKSREFGQNVIDTYHFEVKNTSLEHDNSVGIKLSLPLSIETNKVELVFLDNGQDSPCLNLISFNYLETCTFKIEHIVDLENLEEDFLFDINFSNVISKNVLLNDYFDLSPKDVVLNSERTVVNKAILNHDFVPPSEDNLAQFSSQTGLISIAYESNALKEDNPLSLISDTKEALDTNVIVNNDPDEDNEDGFYIFNNLSFTNQFNVTANLNGYSDYCEINPPFAITGECFLGSFDIPSNNITQSGQFSVSIGVEQGLDSEKTASNSIDLNVFQIKRISKNFAYPKRMASFKGNLYFSALKDGETINSRKLLKYDPLNNSLKQVITFVQGGVGDDRAFPIISYGDYLVLRARNPNNAEISFFIYDDLQNKVEHLYCENCQNVGTQRTLNSVNTISDDETFFTYNDKLYIIARKSNENSENGYLYVYDKNTNTLKKAINNFYVNTNSDNGYINPNSIIIHEGKIVFETYMVNSNDIGSYKLNYYDVNSNKHRYLSNRNGFGENDNLKDPFIYDNKIFYISIGAGDPTQNKPELVYLNLTFGEEKLNRVFTGLVNGEGKILGSYFGKLFFKMKGLNSDVIYYYDALNQEIKKLYETNNGNLIFRIDRFSNFDNINEFYFVEYDDFNSKNHLMIMKQNGLDFVIEKVLDGTGGININEQITMFTYKNHTFFTCGFNLENLCVHNIQKNNLSLVAENIKLYSEPVKIKRNRLEGIILLNNRVYIGTQNSSRGEKSGVYELCLKGSNGCL